MAIGSGLATSIGVGVETTYGTYAAPTRWYEIESETLSFQQNIAQGSGLSGGVFVDRGARRLRTQQDAGGQIVLYATQKGMGLLFAQMLSSDVTPAVTVAPAYSAAHIDNGNGLKGKSLTIQKVVYDETGTARPYTFLGCKITDWQLEMGVGEEAKLTLTIDARQMTEAQAVVAPSYTVGLVPFSFTGGTLLSGAYGLETANLQVRKLTITGKRPMKVDSFFYNNGGLKAEPTQNGKLAISGTLDTEFVDKTRLVDVFHANGNLSLIAGYAGNVITGSTTALMQVAFPQVFLDGATPQAAGPDVIAPSIPFVVTYDDVHAPVTFTYTSTDTAL